MSSRFTQHFTRLFAGLALVGAMAAPSARAEIYKWVDENGKVHFTDRQPTAVESEVVETDDANIYSSQEAFGGDPKQIIEKNREDFRMRQQEKERANRKSPPPGATPDDPDGEDS